MKTSTKLKKYGEFPFFNQVRVPRHFLPTSMTENQSEFFADNYELEQANPSEQFQTISDWSQRIRRLTSQFGSPVEILLPSNGNNKILILGHDRNAQIAANLLRKAVIEISTNKFEPEAMLAFVHTTLIDYEKSRHFVPIIPSCRVDFKIAVKDLSKRQADSFDKMAHLFENLGVVIDFPENRPTVVELSSDNKDALKSAKLTAEWVAKSIAAEQKVTKNGLQQTFSEKSIQALGRDRSHSLRTMTFN